MSGRAVRLDVSSFADVGSELIVAVDGWFVARRGESRHRQERFALCFSRHNCHSSTEFLRNRTPLGSPASSLSLPHPAQWSILGRMALSIVIKRKTCIVDNI